MNAARKRRLLLISYHFPPAGGVPVRRALRLLRHLPESGWSISVLTADRPYDPHHSDDPTALATLPPVEQVLRPPARSFSERLYARVFTGLRLARRQGAQLTGASPDANMVGGNARRLLYETIACPDPKRGWIRGAVQAALKAHSAQPFDAVLATGYPWSAFLAAAQIKQATGLPIVLDYRDAWTLSPRQLWTGRRNLALEEKVLQAATAVTTVTSEISRQMEAAFPWLPAGRIRTITNGHDASELPDPDPLLDDKDRCVLTHTGTFNDALPPSPVDRTPYFLIRAVAQLEPEVRRALRIRLVGTLGPAYRGFIAKQGVEDVIQIVGVQSHSRALQYQLAADALLLIIYDTPTAVGDMTGKLVEYIGAQRPIFATIPEGEAARVIEEHKLGWVVPPSDVESIAVALRTLVRRWRAAELPRGPEIPEFSAERIASQMAEVLDQACEAATARQP